jgi:hypothetical protein
MMASNVVCYSLESCTGSCLRMSRVQTSLSSVVAGGCINTRQYRAYRSSSHVARSRLPRYPQGSGLPACSVKSWEPDRCYSVAGQGTSDPRRTALKEWTQYLTKFSAAIDVGAMTRVLTSLNVDLPKQFTELKKILPSVSFGQNQDQQSMSQKREDKQKLDQNYQQDLVDSSRANTRSEIAADNSKSSRKTSPKAVDYADREQHDFASAMSNVQESITAFHKVFSGDESSHIKTDIRKSGSKEKTVSSVEQVKPTGSAETQGSMLSTLNTVYSGISRQIAGYMPSASAEKTMPTGAAVPVPATASAIEVSRSAAAKQEKPVVLHRKLVARGSIDRQTRGLVLCLREAKTSTSQLVRLEELGRHIMTYPDCIGVAIKVIFPVIMHSVAWYYHAI